MRALLINPPCLTVDAYQVYAYADVVPYGLYQMATLLADQGHQVQVLDMMGYLEGGYARVLEPQNRFAPKAAGDSDTHGLYLDAYLYGRDFDWLERQLGSAPKPDEVLVTCCLAFNFEPAHRVVRACRRAFPAARIRMGGFYPSAFPEHARRSGADEIHVGAWPEAARVFPRFELVERPPRSWLFHLVSGCRYRCSFCCNQATEPRLVCDPRAAADELIRLHRRWGLTEFANWDPNVLQLPEALGAFLDRLAEAGLPLELRFDMGIAPHRLTPELARQMKAAGTRAMTIPFESVDPAMLRRFGKPYRSQDSLAALDTCREAGFDVSRFHCTFLLGIRGEDLGQVFRTYLTILRAGGKPTPFPLTPTPGTREHALHRDQLRGKDLDLLNGHLWPTQGPAERVALYQRALEVVSSLDLETARAQAAGLPEAVGELFEAEAAALFGAGPPVLPRHRRQQVDRPAWLHAMCLGCLHLEDCRRREDRREPDPERCYAERRGLDLDRLADLFAALRRRAGLPGSDRLARHEQRMWRHLAELQTRCANTFEPSLSWDGERWHAYRYTYSFHDADPDRWAEDQSELSAWLELLAPRVRPHAEAMLAVADPPLARGMLFGLDARSDGRTRYKVYLRLHPGHEPEKHRLLRALCGQAWPNSDGLEPERLFILGFDLAPGGVQAIKYYFLHERLASAAFLGRFAPDTFYPQVASLRGIEEWREVILIARQTAARRREPPAAVEANLHCLRNDLGLDDLDRSLACLAEPPDLGPVAELFADHPLALSSCTFPIGHGSKANLYYRLVG